MSQGTLMLVEVVVVVPVTVEAAADASALGTEHMLFEARPRPRPVSPRGSPSVLSSWPKLSVPTPSVLPLIEVAALKLTPNWRWRSAETSTITACTKICTRGVSRSSTICLRVCQSCGEALTTIALVAGSAVIFTGYEKSMLLPAELADAGPLLPPDELLRLLRPPPPLPPKPPELLVPPKPPPPLEPPKLELLDRPLLPKPPTIPPKPELPPLAAWLKLERPSDPLPVLGDRVDGLLPPLSRLLSTWTISVACAFLSRYTWIRDVDNGGLTSSFATISWISRIWSGG